jgi:hypothetical protein
MESRFLLCAGIVAVAVIALNVLLRRLGRKDVRVKERVRRGTKGKNRHCILFN